MAKKYPFSQAKHAHDIEFQLNRCKNIEYDYFGGDIKLTNEEFDALEERIDALEELLLAIIDNGNGYVTYLTGPQIGLAKEVVGWASNTRAASCIARGRYDLLKYC